MDNFNQQFLLSVSIIIVGYILKRFDIIREREGEGMTRIVLNVTLPSLIIVSFSDMNIQPSLFFLTAFSLVYGGMMAALGLFLFRKEGARTRGMFAMMFPGFNIGLFAFPLVEGIWGANGLKHFGMFDVGNAFILFGLNYTIAAYFASEGMKLNYKDILKTLSRSIPLMTYIGVLLLALLNIHLPDYFLELTGVISQANMPLSLLLLGVYLNFRFEKSNMRLIGKYLVFRYGFGLVIGLALFWFLPMEDMVRYTLLVGLLLPAATSNLAFSVEFGYNTKLIGTISNMTLIISFVLLWLAVNLIM